MELRTLTPDMPALLAEMGVSYNPDKLAEALKGREVEISARGVKVATTFAGCLGNILKVIQDSLLADGMIALRYIRRWHEDCARDVPWWLHLARQFSCPNKRNTVQGSHFVSF